MYRNNKNPLRKITVTVRTVDIVRGDKPAAYAKRLALRCQQLAVAARKR
jgi:hypothetical protein